MSWLVGWLVSVLWHINSSIFVFKNEMSHFIINIEENWLGDFNENMNQVIAWLETLLKYNTTVLN